MHAANRAFASAHNATSRTTRHIRERGRRIGHTEIPATELHERACRIAVLWFEVASSHSRGPLLPGLGAGVDGVGLGLGGGAVGAPLVGGGRGLGGGLCGESGEEGGFGGVGGDRRIGIVGVGVLGGVVEAGAVDCWVRVVGVLCCSWVWGLLVSHLAFRWHIAGTAVAVIGTIGIHE